MYIYLSGPINKLINSRDYKGPLLLYFQRLVKIHVTILQLFNFLRSMYGVNDVCVLEDQKEHHTVIEIRIKSCKGKFKDTVLFHMTNTQL